MIEVVILYSVIFQTFEVPDEDLSVETCPVRHQCWYKDLRKPIVDLLPGYKGKRQKYQQI